MNKKQIIALADTIREQNQKDGLHSFTEDHVETLSEFCSRHNPAFLPVRWRRYIAGEVNTRGNKL